MTNPCNWPEGTCACYAEKAEADSKEDRRGRVWMHCEEGLNLSKASMGRFMAFCLTNRVEIGSIYPFAPEYPRSQVSSAIRLRPDQFAEFESQTGGILRTPPRMTLNSTRESIT